MSKVPLFSKVLETLGSVFRPVISVEFLRYAMTCKDFLYLIDNTLGRFISETFNLYVF